MTARHASIHRSRQLTLAGVLVIAMAIIGLFLHSRPAGADTTHPTAADATAICIPLPQPICITTSPSDSPTSTDPGIPTSSTVTDTSTPTDTTTAPTDSTSASDPVTVPVSSSSATVAPPVNSTPGRSTPAGSTSSAAPVGTLGTQNPNQDAPISSAQNCDGLVCASTTYDPASAAAGSVNASGTAAPTATLPNTGSPSRLGLELSMLLLASGLMLLVAGNRRVAGRLVRSGRALAAGRRH